MRNPYYIPAYSEKHYLFSSQYTHTHTGKVAPSTQREHFLQIDNRWVHQESLVSPYVCNLLLFVIFYCVETFCNFKSQPPNLKSRQIWVKNVPRKLVNLNQLSYSKVSQLVGTIFIAITMCHCQGHSILQKKVLLMKDVPTIREPVFCRDPVLDATRLFYFMPK